MRILIINGPNLNLLGKREPGIYGSMSFEEYLDKIEKTYSAIDISYYQSNVEGELINRLHDANDAEIEGIILNAAGYSHSSVALADAVAAINIPVVSMHISNIYSREPERHHELLSKHVIGGIYGMGLLGYELALQFLVRHIASELS